MDNIDSQDQNSEIVIRQLQNNEEYLACEALEKETWGQNFSECVPPSILMVTQKIGGVTAGAFDEKDRLIGFIYGLTGWQDGRLIHWSHMLAVREEYRNRRLGTRLKLFQRDFVKRLDIEHIYWTYDPLVAKNAHINLNRLGASIEEYVPHMYVEGNESELHRGIGMDRFVIKWEVSKPSPEDPESIRSASEKRFSETPVINMEPSESGTDNMTEPNLTHEGLLRVEVPWDIHEIQRRSLSEAEDWRENTRSAFLHYLQKNYKVQGFYRDAETGRCFYGLASDDR